MVTVALNEGSHIYNITSHSVFQGNRTVHVNFTSNTDNSNNYPRQENDLFNITEGVIDNGTNVTNIDVETDIVKGIFCTEWTGAQHPLYQLANLCLLIAFLTPHTFKFHAMFMRFVMALSFMLLIIWSYVFVCMFDTFGWNMALFFINLAYVGYLGFKNYPVKIPTALETVFEKVFKPLKISQAEFLDMVNIGNVVVYPKGSLYAVEDVTSCGERFSILTKGRMKVCHKQTFLHHINSHEFVDSLEYESWSPHDGTRHKYQVSITAVDDCCLLALPVQELHDLLQDNADLSAILDRMIGKDISAKMYQMQETMIRNSLMNSKEKNRPGGGFVFTGTCRKISSVSLKDSNQMNNFNFTEYDKASHQDGMVVEPLLRKSSSSTYETSL